MTPAILIGIVIGVYVIAATGASVIAIWALRDTLRGPPGPPGPQGYTGPMGVCECRCVRG